MRCRLFSLIICAILALPGPQAHAGTGTAGADILSQSSTGASEETKAPCPDTASIGNLKAPAPRNSAEWPEWAHRARLAGASFELEMSHAEIETKLRKLADEGVSVVVADAPTGWSYTAWTHDEELNEVLSMMRDEVIPQAHTMGLKVVWYLTSLELICSECAATGFDPGTEHPEWLQIDRFGRALEFSGVQGVFWLEENDYDLWLSPESPYADFYLGQIRKIATAGADGLWMDVAYLLNGLGQFDDLWPSTDPYSQAAFEAASGETGIPAKNWEDLSWRHWIRWRMQSIANFVDSVAEAAHSVDPEILFFTENWCMDSNFVTQYSQDPLDFSASSGVATAHELEPIDQDDRGMQDASLEDWQDYALLVRFAVASNSGRPGWVLTYAGAVADSLREAAVHLSEGANYYEARGPEMLDDSTGSRPTVFAWIEANEVPAYSGRSMADVALYFSPRSRDFIDGEESGDDKFDEGDTIYFKEYRRRARELLSGQIQFDIVSSPSGPEDLQPYNWLVIPGAACLSDTEISVIRAYVAEGGKIATTSEVGSRDEWCVPRSSGTLSDIPSHEISEITSSLLSTDLPAADRSRLLVNARSGNDAEGPFIFIGLADMRGPDFDNTGIGIRLPSGFSPTGIHWNSTEGGSGELEFSIEAGLLHFTLPRVETGAAVLIRGSFEPDPSGPRLPTGRAG